MDVVTKKFLISKVGKDPTGIIEKMVGRMYFVRITELLKYTNLDFKGYDMLNKMNFEKLNLFLDKLLFKKKLVDDFLEEIKGFNCGLYNIYSFRDTKTIDLPDVFLLLL